jgi:hypothetical protein
MSKYQPLSERLRGHASDEWRASFAEVEEVLGFPLPKGARSRKAWWSNDLEKPHSRAWSGHGWEAGDVDTSTGQVTFRRSAVSPAVVEAVAGLEPVGDLSAAEPLDPLAIPRPPSGELMPATPPASEVQPKPAPLAAALIAASVAVAAGLGALLVRGILRRR